MAVAAGLASIGGWVAGAVGATVSTGMAAVIGGAIVGAAIGGLTAAITGGDIGKGLLFGAVGGAVLGGVGAWAADLSFTTGTTSLGTAAQGVNLGTDVGSLWGGSGALTEGAGAGGDIFITGSGSAGGGLWSGAGSAAVTTLGTSLQGAFSEDAADPNDPEERQKDRDLEYAKIEASKEIAAMQSSSSSGSSTDSASIAAEASMYATDAELQNAREQREADWKVVDREYSEANLAKQERSAAVQGLQVTGDNVMAAAPKGKSINQQAYEQAKYPGTTVESPVPAQTGVLNQPEEQVA